MPKNYESYSKGNITNGSQLYEDLYNVVHDMLEYDKKDKNIYSSEKGYFKNPSALVLQDAFKYGKLFKDDSGKVINEWIYVIDEYNTFIVGIRLNPNSIGKRSPHPALIGGKYPKVKCAGILKLKNNKILSVNNHSGHYKPDIKSLKLAEDILQKLYNENPLWFHEESKWRKRK